MVDKGYFAPEDLPNVAPTPEPAPAGNMPLMKTGIAVELTWMQAKALSEFAGELGVDGPTAVRLLIHSQLEQRGYIPPPFTRQPPPSYEIPASIIEQGERLGQRMGAAMGTLNCPQCSQRITVKDVDSGICGHCNAKLTGDDE